MLRSGMILALATLWYPEYEIKAWHQYLMYALIIWLAIGVNVFGSQILPMFNKAMSKSERVELVAVVTMLKKCHSGFISHCTDCNFHHHLGLRS